MKFSLNATDLDKKFDELINGKEGRKVLRRSSQVALETFNEATVKQVKQIPLKKSGKGWRKALSRKSSAFKYAWTGLDKKKGGKFSATTGVNYKIPILRLTHLVESGFNNVKSGRKVKGHFFREKSFDTNALKGMRQFRNALFRSYDFLAKTGKAPGLKMTRSFR